VKCRDRGCRSGKQEEGVPEWKWYPLLKEGGGTFCKFWDEDRPKMGGGGDQCRREYTKRKNLSLNLIGKDFDAEAGVSKEKLPSRKEESGELQEGIAGTDSLDLGGGGGPFQRGEERRKRTVKTSQFE